MKIYHFRPEDGAFIGTGFADADPIENPDADINGTWLIPAHATDKKPPNVPEGKLASFQGEAWVLVDIPVAETLDDEEEGIPFTSDRDHINFLRDAGIGGNMIFEDHAYQADIDSRENIAGAANLAFQVMSMGGGAEGDYRWIPDDDEEFFFIAADNVRVLMDAPTTHRFGVALLKHKKDWTLAASDLKKMDPIPSDYMEPKYWPGYSAEAQTGG